MPQKRLQCFSRATPAVQKKLKKILDAMDSSEHESPTPTPKKRVLTRHESGTSNVSLDEDGFPAMLTHSSPKKAANKKEVPPSPPSASSLTQERVAKLSVEALHRSPLPSTRAGLKEIALKNTPAKKDFTRVLKGQWGKVRLSGGKHKSYIQYQEKASNKWKSLVNFTDSQDPNFKDVSLEVFEFLCDNPIRIQGQAERKEQEIPDRLAKCEPGANPQTDGEMGQDDEEPRCMQLRFCDFWDE